MIVDHFDRQKLSVSSVIMAGASSSMDQGEKIFNKVSSLWPIVCNCSRDFLIRNLPLLMENDTISKYSFEKGEWKEKEFSLKNIKNPDELAKSCLSSQSQKNLF